MPETFESCRLSEADVPEIGELLNRVWAAQYGDTGGDLSSRFAVARYQSLLHPLAEVDPRKNTPKGDISFVFFEDAKALAQSSRRIHSEKGVGNISSQFQQAVLDRHTLQIRPRSRDVSLRLAGTEDYDALHRLMSLLTLSGFTWHPSRETMAHHFHAAPDARVWLAERADRTVGFLAGYTLDWQRNGKFSRMFILETMAAEDDEVVTALLSEASTHAVSSKLRGVVIENLTYLPLDNPRAFGVIETPRKMRAVARSTGVHDGIFEQFLCDIK